MHYRAKDIPASETWLFHFLPTSRGDTALGQQERKKASSGKERKIALNGSVVQQRYRHRQELHCVWVIGGVISGRVRFCPTSGWDGALSDLPFGGGKGRQLYLLGKPPAFSRLQTQPLTEQQLVSSGRLACDRKVRCNLLLCVPPKDPVTARPPVVMS